MLEQLMILIATAILLTGFVTAVKSKPADIDRAERKFRKQYTRINAFGNPYKKKKGVYYYKRKDLPEITEFIRRASRAVVFVEVTGRGFFEVLESEGPTVTDEKKILAWLFPDNSEILERHAVELGLPELTVQAARSMEILTRVRDRIEHKENLEIRILRSYLSHSMIIVDPGELNSFMEVVEYSKNPMEEWKAKIIIKRENPAEYERYFLEYQKVIEDSWKADG
jgi:hypothetical protein